MVNIALVADELSMNIQYWWSDNDGRKLNYLENLSQCHFVHYKPHRGNMLTDIDHYDHKFPLDFCLPYEVFNH